MGQNIIIVGAGGVGKTTLAKIADEVGVSIKEIEALIEETEAIDREKLKEAREAIDKLQITGKELKYREYFVEPKIHPKHQRHNKYRFKK